MKYAGTLIAVADMARAREFYTGIFGLAVTGDFGANVTLEGGLFLQTADTWTHFIHGKAVAFGANAAELVFETDDFDGFLQMLAARASVEYVHTIEEQPWGQRVVRFYDPDHHIIEVGEAMTIVTRRFIDGGMTAEECAARMDVPVEAVRFFLSQ